MATREANQERWGRTKDVYGQWDNSQKNAEVRKHLTAAIHLGIAFKNGAMSRDLVDLTYQRVRHGSFAFKTAKQAQRLDQMDQDKTEESTMHKEAQRFDQMDQDKTEEAAMHKEAQRILRMMKETMMPKEAQRLD